MEDNALFKRPTVVSVHHISYFLSNTSIFSSRLHSCRLYS